VGKAPVGSTGSGFNTRAAYLKKVAELATKHFIDQDRPIVAGIILAGSAELKDHLQKHLFDVRIQQILLSTVDIAYGGENGFHQAVGLCANLLESVRFVEESKLIGSFFEWLTTNGDMVAYGPSLFSMLDQGAVEKILVWDKVSMFRYQFVCEDQQSEVIFSPKEHLELTQRNKTLVSKISVLDWFLGMDLREDNSLDSEAFHRTVELRLKGAQVEIVSANSPEGNQFCKAFSGLGAFLRYPVPMDDYFDDEDDQDDNLSDHEEAF